jgi:hypothetical protein
MITKYTYNFSTRFITRGIQSGIPISLITELWKVLDKFLETTIQKDYLQVFKLTITENNLALEHFQEEPNYRQNLLLGVQLRNELMKINSSKEIKIYVIDDEDHSTMLLAEEY